MPARTGGLRPSRTLSRIHFYQNQRAAPKLKRAVEQASQSIHAQQFAQSNTAKGIELYESKHSAYSSKHLQKSTVLDMNLSIFHFNRKRGKS